MSLIPWSPFFDSLNGVEKFMDNFPSPARGANGLIPAIDVYDAKDAVVVETSLPGVDPKHIELNIENGVVTIKGSTERKTEVDDKNYYRKEIRSGSFMRQVALPSGVKGEDASASFENGILKIRIPKAELPQSKSIKINIEEN